MTSDNNFNHIPVLFDECIDALNITGGNGVYLDGTLGGGGHSLGILKKLESGKLISFDLDLDAIASASKRLEEHKDKLTIIHDNYKNFEKHLDEMNIEKLDGILLDLGISSYQIDTGERGFSYIRNAPLDMRMDRTQGITAKDVVNEYSEEELTKIFFEYGEERQSKRVARAIVIEREKKVIETTGELAEIIAKTITFQGGGHPAKKIFQAIRIEVNGELRELSETVTAMARRLKPNGRMAVITFHSLEDRIVKNAFKELELDCVCDKSFPICVCGKKSEIKLINKKPITASNEELARNRRAESAKLRIIEKI